MKINEKTEEMQSRLIKKVIEVSSYSKEDAIKQLEILGLDKDAATKLLIAYREAEAAKTTAQNVWDSAWNSKSGVDFSTDIAKYQQKEAEAREYFDVVKAECALQIVTNAIEPSEINDENLSILYEQGVQESQIINPALKITFHYYSESRRKDDRRTEDLGKVREYSSRIGAQMQKLEEQWREAESQNAQLKKSNQTLQKSYQDLQTKFQARIESDEKNYQAALTQIRILKNKLAQIQKRGIFKVIGDKIAGIFGDKTEKLPETIEKIPDTLFQNKGEKIGMPQLDEAEILFINSRTNEPNKDRANDSLEQK